MTSGATSPLHEEQNVLFSSFKRFKEFFKEPIQVSQRTLKTWFFKRTISGSTNNLSNQGSLKNHVLKEFFKEPIKVSQRTFKHGSLRNHFWFLKEPFKPGFFREPFP